MTKDKPITIKPTYKVKWECSYCEGRTEVIEQAKEISLGDQTASAMRITTKGTKDVVTNICDICLKKVFDKALLPFEALINDEQPQYLAEEDK